MVRVVLENAPSCLTVRVVLEDPTLHSELRRAFREFVVAEL